MISVDTMEVLLRSIPQYFLFGALVFLVLSWMNKKPLYSMIAEIIMIVVALLLLIVMVNKYIPSPNTEGMNKEHLEKLVKMILFFYAVGILSAVSLIIRLVRKAPFKPIVIAIFVLCMILFFQSTAISKIKFELNKPTTAVSDSIK